MTIKKVRAMWHPGDITEALIRKHEFGEPPSMEMCNRIVRYRDEEFNPLPELTDTAWGLYVLASEYAARAFDVPVGV